MKVKKESKMSRVLSVVLAITMMLGMIPAGLMTVGAFEAVNPDTVAVIGDKEYLSLADALADVPFGENSETPEPTEIELVQNTQFGFDVGTADGKTPQNIVLKLNGNTLTLGPAIGSTGTETNGIRVLANSELTVTDGIVKCSDNPADNIKVGFANYSKLTLDNVNVQSGVKTIYTINNRGALLLNGETSVANGEVEQTKGKGDYIAITNDPYNFVYTGNFPASLTCDSAGVKTGTVQVERYERTNNNTGGVELNISAGYFDRIIEDGAASVNASYNVTGGTIGVYNGEELAVAVDMIKAGAGVAPKAPVTIKLNDDVKGSFDVGNADGTEPKNIILDLCGKTLTLGPAIGSTGTETNGIRVLANSELTVVKGTVKCSDEANDNIKVGFANYSELTLTSVDVQSGVKTIYTVNNRGTLTLLGNTSVANGQVEQTKGKGDYIAITNDAYNYVYTDNRGAILNCNSSAVTVGNVQVERYARNSANRGGVSLNINAGTFESVYEDGAKSVPVNYEVTGGNFKNKVEIDGFLKYSKIFKEMEDGSFAVVNQLLVDDFKFEEEDPQKIWVGASYTNIASSKTSLGKVTYAIVGPGYRYAEVDPDKGEVTFKAGAAGKEITVRATLAAYGDYAGTTKDYYVTPIKNEDTSFRFKINKPGAITWGDNNNEYVNVASGGDGTGTITYTVDKPEIATVDSNGKLTILKSGTVTVTAVREADDKYETATATYTITINKAKQAPLTFNGLTTVNPQPQYTIIWSPDVQKNIIDVLGGSGKGDITYEIVRSSSDTEKIADIDSDTITTYYPGWIDVKVTKAEDDCYKSTYNLVKIKINAANQEGFKFNEEGTVNRLFNDLDNTYTNTASGGEVTPEKVTYKVVDNLNVASVDLNTGTVTIKQAGTVTIRATKEGNKYYNLATAEYTLDIKAAEQSFTVDDLTLTYGTKAYQITVNPVYTKEDGTNKYGFGTGEYTYEIDGANNIGASIDENGKLTFADSEQKIGTITVKVTKAADECYASCEKTFTVKVEYLVVDNAVDKIEISGGTKNDSGWYTGDITVTAPEGYQISYSNKISAKWDTAVTVESDGVNSPVVYLKNSEGYITDAIKLNDLKLDKYAPTALGFEYKDNFVQVVLNAITFNAFDFSEIETEYVTVILTAVDATSNIASLKYYLNDEETVVEFSDPVYEMRYEIKVPAQYRDKVSFRVTDVAGNESAKSETGETLVVDTMPPVMIIDEASYKYESGAYNDYGDIIYTQKSVTIGFVINEANGDLSVSPAMGAAEAPVVTVNGTVQEAVWTFDKGNLKSEITLSGDGDYAVEVKYADASKNEMETYSQEFHIDSKAPEFTVTYDNNEAKYDNIYKLPRTAAVSVNEHNFNTDAIAMDVEITAKDITGKKDVVITSKLYEEYIKNPKNWTMTGEDTYTLNSAGMVFDIDAVYTITLTLTDIAGNAGVYETTFVIDQTDAKVVSLDYDEKITEKFLNAITFGFFKDSVTVTATITDETSGVESAAITYTKETGASSINVETFTAEMNFKSHDENTNTFVYTYDIPANDIPANARGTVSVTAVDNAGNDGIDGERNDMNYAVGVIVDNINPVISVEYAAAESGTAVHYTNGELRADVDNFADADTAYFNGNVTAKITVNEANFFEGVSAKDLKTGDWSIINEVGIMLTKVDDYGNKTVTEYLPAGATPKTDNYVYMSWENAEGSDDYSFTIVYDDNADYTLEVEYTDFSENAADINGSDGNAASEKYTSKTVTVDKTAPVVTVDYKNKTVVQTINGREYLESTKENVLTAKITVVEHNFRASDFAATVEAKNSADGKVAVEDFAKTLSSADKWVYEGNNTYTATVEYPVDANYTFDYNFKDLALNDADDYEADLFTVDKTLPENLKVSYSMSVLDKILDAVTFGYYNSKVIVTISADDATSGVDRFVYSYRKSDNVSSVNAQLLNAAIQNAEFVSVDGKTSTAQFTIPKEVLQSENQFNGTVEFEAVDRSANTSKKLEDTRRVIVDNIAPTAEITYNEPVQNANNISYYAGNIDAKIVINEANFYSEDVVVKVNGAPISVNWTDNSVDIHTGTFTLTEDGDYAVTVDYTDRSSNTMASYESNQLTIDTKAPSLTVTNIKNNNAFKDDPFTFTITADDINLDASSIKPVLTAIVRAEDGTYSQKTIDIAKMTTADNKTFTVTVANLEEDAVYSLSCSLKDMAGNIYSKVLLSDDNRSEYDSVRFSVNRNGSTFSVDEKTLNLMTQYYVYSVNNDIVIEEINTDPLEKFAVKLNGKVLTEGKEYTAAQINNDGEWSKTVYTVNKNLFDAEGVYSIVVESTDHAGTDAFSDVKNLNVSFVVDRTAPVLTISGLENGGRYQVGEQTVTVIPTDDGGRLRAMKVIVLDSDGNPLKNENGEDISVRFEMYGEEFLKYLNENNGVVTFTVPEGLENQVQIICNDCAVKADRTTNEYNVTFKKVTVSQSGWVIYYANKPLFYGSIAGVLLLIAGLTIIIVLKKRKKK